MKISVKVKPNAKQERVEKIGQNSFLACVKAGPVEGKANAAVVKALAEYFGVPRCAVTLVKGRSSQQKIFDILT